MLIWHSIPGTLLRKVHTYSFVIFLEKAPTRFVDICVVVVSPLTTHSCFGTNTFQMSSPELDTYAIHNASTILGVLTSDEGLLRSQKVPMKLLRERIEDTLVEIAWDAATRRVDRRNQISQGEASADTDEEDGGVALSPEMQQIDAGLSKL
jgi:hypothetical protein